MAIAPGSQGQPIFCIVAGVVNYSLDGGTTWTAAEAGSIPPGTLPLTALAPQAADTFVANGTGGSASPTAITPAAAAALLPVATPSAAGLMSGQYASNLLSMAMFESPLIDLTASPASYPLIMPSLPGYYCLGVRIVGFLVSFAGTQSTAPTLSIGNNASSFNNIMATTAETTATAGATGAPIMWFGISGATSATLVDLTTIPKVNVTVSAAGTGGYAATGKVAVMMWLSRLT